VADAFAAWYRGAPVLVSGSPGFSTWYQGAPVVGLAGVALRVTAALPAAWAGGLAARAPLPLASLGSLAARVALPTEWTRALALRATLGLGSGGAVGVAVTLPLAYASVVALVATGAGLPVEAVGGVTAGARVPLAWTGALVQRATTPLAWGGQRAAGAALAWEALATPRLLSALPLEAAGAAVPLALTVGAPVEWAGLAPATFWLTWAIDSPFAVECPLAWTVQPTSFVRAFPLGWRVAPAIPPLWLSWAVLPRRLREAFDEDLQHPVAVATKRP